MVGVCGGAIWKINKKMKKIPLKQEEKTIQEISQQLIIKHKTKILKT